MDLGVEGSLKPLGQLPGRSSAALTTSVSSRSILPERPCDTAVFITVTGDERG